MVLTEPLLRCLALCTHFQCLQNVPNKQNLLLSAKKTDMILFWSYNNITTLNLWYSPSN